MIGKAFAGFAFVVAASAPAAIVAAQAQAPEAEKPGTPAAPAQAQRQPTPVQPAPATQSGPSMQLPPVKIIQAPAAPPKPAKKPAPAAAPVPARRVTPSARRVEAAPLPAPATEAETAPETAVETAGQGVAMTPLKGSEIPLDKVPAGVSQVSSGEIAQSGSPAIEQALQQNVPGVIVTDVNGNPFSTDVQYRGFSASPIEGTPQGLAVYQNGVRINEVFGDTVNWDLIPSSAINGIAVVSGNPLYGLNALGGALNITMKDGFGFQGVESDTRGGSYGRIQESLQLGKQIGNFAAYAAIEGIHDDGWRYFSPSDVLRMYTDLGVKDKDTEFHINFTGASNRIGVVGPTPVDLLAQNYSAVFTSPQTTENRLAMVSANGSTKLTDTWTLSGVAYLRSFHQQHADGNVTEVAPCNILDGGTGYDPASPLCLQTVNGDIAAVTNRFGKTIPTGKYYGPGDTIGEIDYSTNNTNSYGTSLQATNKDALFGHKNLFIAGASVDHGDVKTTSVAELGTLNTQNFKVAGNGLFLSGPLDIAPVDLKVTTNYYGLFFFDTLDVTNALSVTVGGRYNYEDISLQDRLMLPGSNLSGDHIYTRFNPMAGATYKFNANFSAYGGYAEANRAPTPAELACADPAQPCLLQNFLVSDPNLNQVVSKTWQGGLRGSFSPFGYGRLDWSAGVFRTQNYNDIINVTSPIITTRGYFQNAGDTLRQGVEAYFKYRAGDLTLSANYAYVDATFLNNLVIPSPSNPFANEDGNIFVHPGDHIPTIPPHRLKVSFDYNVTDAWKVGADVVLASSQYFFGDESNQNPQLPGYGVVNLRTAYEVANGVTVYGLINNVFDHKYATYGTFYDTEIRNVSGELSTSLSNPAMITPAQPFSVYGGVKVRF